MRPRRLLRHDRCEVRLRRLRDTPRRPRRRRARRPARQRRQLRPLGHRHPAVRASPPTDEAVRLTAPFGARAAARMIDVDYDKWGPAVAIRLRTDAPSFALMGWAST